MVIRRHVRDAGGAEVGRTRARRPLPALHARHVHEPDPEGLQSRLLIVTDRARTTAVREAAYVNIRRCLLRHGRAHEVRRRGHPLQQGRAQHWLPWWMLARVLRMRIHAAHDHVGHYADLYFYRDPEEVEKEEAEAARLQQDKVQRARRGRLGRDRRRRRRRCRRAERRPRGRGRRPAVGRRGATVYGAGADNWTAAPAGGDWSKGAGAGSGAARAGSLASCVYTV